LYSGVDIGCYYDWHEATAALIRTNICLLYCSAMMMIVMIMMMMMMMIHGR